MYGVIQRDLAADLKSKKINVAIVGETHHEINPDEETSAWGKEGINLYYEADDLPHSAMADPVQPDPLFLRLTFAWAALTEDVSDFLKTVSQSGKVADTSGFKNANFVLKYLLPILRSDLRRVESSEPKLALALELIEELLPLLAGSKPASLASSDELARKVLASKLRRNMSFVTEILSDLHSKSEFKKVAYTSSDLRVERSRQMLLRVNQFSGAMEKTIYKVGDHHVRDMRDNGWKVEAGVKVFTQQEYLVEYRSLAQKPKPTVMSVSSSSSSKYTVTPVSSSSSNKSSPAPSSSSAASVLTLPEGWAQSKNDKGQVYYYIPDQPSSSTWTLPTSPAPRKLVIPSPSPLPLSTPKISSLKTPVSSTPSVLVPTPLSVLKLPPQPTPLSSKGPTMASTSSPVSKHPTLASSPSLVSKTPTLVSSPSLVSKTPTLVSSPSLVSKPPAKLVSSPSLVSQTPKLASSSVSSKPPNQSSRSSVSSKPPKLVSSSNASSKPPTPSSSLSVSSKPSIVVAPRRPVWVPDDFRPTCSKCPTEFGTFTRRHHCRACGEVFCSKCCSQKKQVPVEIQAVEDKKSPSPGPVLVCNDCFFYT